MNCCITPFVYFLHILIPDPLHSTRTHTHTHTHMFTAPYLKLYIGILLPCSLVATAYAEVKQKSASTVAAATEKLAQGAMWSHDLINTIYNTFCTSRRACCMLWYFPFLEFFHLFDWWLLKYGSSYITSCFFTLPNINFSEIVDDRSRQVDLRGGSCEGGRSYRSCQDRFLFIYY